MKPIGIINSDPEIQSSLKKELQGTATNNYAIHCPQTQQDIINFLNYEMPEIVITNFSDPNIDIQPILDVIRQDPWLHSFGMIGIFDSKKGRRMELLPQLNGYNILNLIQGRDIPYSLSKTLRIVEENRQLLFQKKISTDLLKQSSGAFEIENDPLAVPCYAGLAAICLTNQGYMNDAIKNNLLFALIELIMNGIEHGNCGISYEEKSAFLEQGGNMSDLIKQKCQDPNIAARRVYFEFSINPTESIFTIRDSGKGFNWKKMLETKPDPLELCLHGRGISMTQQLLRTLSYNDKGNEATITIPHESTVPRETPFGFAMDDILSVTKGDVIFKEGEVSDYLYYIAQGCYSVYKGSKQIGHITADDIFMGEMAFLSNGPRSATVEAEHDGKLVKISKQSFIEAVKKYPYYGIFISKLLARKLDAANQQSYFT